MGSGPVSIVTDPHAPTRTLLPVTDGYLTGVTPCEGTFCRIRNELVRNERYGFYAIRLDVSSACRLQCDPWRQKRLQHSGKFSKEKRCMYMRACTGKALQPVVHKSERADRWVGCWRRVPLLYSVALARGLSRAMLGYAETRA